VPDVNRRVKAVLMWLDGASATDTRP